MFICFQHQQCLALFNRIKFTRLLLTALIAFTKKEVINIQCTLQIVVMSNTCLLICFCLILSSEKDHIEVFSVLTNGFVFVSSSDQLGGRGPEACGSGS